MENADDDPRDSFRYKRLKWTTFFSMYFGYGLVVLCRKSFSFSLPAVVATGVLAKDQLGLIVSMQNMGYSISKFIGGVLSDKLNSRFLFSIGLFLTGMITFTFSNFETAGIFSVLWFMNGIVQGGCWPACTKILRKWFSRANFGTWYATLNTTMNVSCSVGPIIVAIFLAKFDNNWRLVMRNFGIAAVFFSMFCMMFMTNSPKEAGLPKPGNTSTPTSDHIKGDETWRDLIRSPFLALLMTCFLVVFLIRTAALDWGQLMLLEEKGQSSYTASAFISSLELGGTVGSVIAGFVADKLVSANLDDPDHEYKGTPRMKVVIVYVAISIAALHSFIFVLDADSSKTFCLLVGFLMGFGIYGPIAMYGVMAIESAPDHLGGTSGAIVSLSANLGAVLAGLPFSLVAKKYQWKGGFTFLEGLLIFVLIIKILGRNLDYKMIPEPSPKED